MNSNFLWKAKYLEHDGHLSNGSSNGVISKSVNIFSNHVQIFWSKPCNNLYFPR